MVIVLKLMIRMKIVPMMVRTKQTRIALVLIWMTRSTNMHHQPPGTVCAKFCTRCKIQVSRPAQKPSLSHKT